jgi:hypothetical protein
MKTADAVFIPKSLRDFHELCSTARRSYAVNMKMAELHSPAGRFHPEIPVLAEEGIYPSSSYLFTGNSSRGNFSWRRM